MCCARAQAGGEECLHGRNAWHRVLKAEQDEEKSVKWQGSDTDLPWNFLAQVR